jgi:hypothetical protein
MKPEDKAVVQQALELFDRQWQCSALWSLEESQEAAETLRQLLEQPAPVQKPHDSLLNFVCHLIDNEEGETISEEGLQRSLADFLAAHTTPPAQPSTDHSEQHLDMVDHGDELTIAYLDGVHTGKQLAKRDLLKALERLLVVQDELCSIDHHGYCQSHYLDNVNSHGGCRVANARALVAKVRGKP